MLRISTLNTRIGGSSTFLNPLRTTTLAAGRQQPLITPSRHLLRQSPTVINTTNTFSTSAQCAAAIEKKALNKKITLPKDPYLLSEKVVKFSKNGKLDDAITLVMESPKSRQNEVVWNHLIQESSKLGKINQSWQLLNDMKKRGFEPSERTFTILLNSLAINASSPNSVERARALYDQIQESTQDLTPTTVHTNALLKVCTRQHDYTALQEIYSSMSKSGDNAPDVITYSTVINAYARKGGDEGFEAAWKVWEDLVEAKARRGEDVELDSRIVDGVLLACRGARSAVFMKRGYKLVESLYGLPASSTPSTIPTSASGAGSVAGSSMTSTERAISPTKSLGLPTAPLLLQDKTIHPRTVELLLSICAKLKDQSRATHYMSLIQTTFPHFQPDPQLLSSLMHLQISNRQYDTALSTWDEISAKGLQHTPGTFKQGLDAALKARNWEKTWEMYTLMRTLIDKNKHLSSSSSSAGRHNTLVNPLVRTQDAWTLVSTLKCAVKTKHLEEGLEILRRTRWTKVVQNPQYPRANADLTDLAVKILAGNMKSRKEAFDRTSTTSFIPTTTTTSSSSSSSSDTTGATTEGENTTSGDQERHEREMEKLKRELSDAKAMQTQMSKALADHDAGKAAQKEIEDANRFRNRRSPSSSSSSSSSEPSRYGSSSRTSSSSRYSARGGEYSNGDERIEADNEALSGGGGGGWRKVSAEEYTESNNNKHQKPWTRGNSAPTSSTSSFSDRSQRPHRGGSGGGSPGSSYSPRRYQRGDEGNSRASVNDAFTPTKRFVRTIDE
ncbi:hypothetical protein BGZ96_009507 [Linnemannia gamsii]|uniref:Pentacotripeptide-repeat region of PRORP domain-containing protein n=1 Tax=Linnemannia gamsii TaxID=64522 RepID=A0ABQ7KE87_9FUNG|nr:hypothetical protein BGZ96_009507 [Linnemannia gamsii]